MIRALAKPFAAAALVLLAGAALSLVLFRFAQDREEGRVKAAFERDASNRIAALRRTLASSLSVVDALAAFYEGSIAVERHEFEAFATHVLSHNPSIQALEWLPRVTRTDRERVEQQAREGGLEDFEIRERDLGGSLVRAGDREVYFPVFFVEPLPGNEAAVGFDVASDSTRFAALEQARDSGEPTATAPIRLVQETARQHGFLVVHAIYRTGGRWDTVAARREALRGYVLAVFRIGDLLASSLAYLDPQDLEFHLFDVSTTPHQDLLHARLADAGDLVDTDPLDDAALAAEPLYAETLHVGGRAWRTWCVPTSSYLHGMKGGQSWIFLVGGALITGLLAGYVLLVRRGTERTRRHTGQLLVAKEGLEAEVAQRRDAEMRLRRSHRALRARVECERAMVRAHDESGLLEAFCRILSEVGGYRLVWVGYAEHDERKSVRPVASHGHEAGYLDAVEVTWAEDARGLGPTGTAIRTGKPSLVRSIQRDPVFGPWREEALRRGYAASLGLPLRSGEESFGAVNVYAEDPSAFDEQELELLEDLADDLAYGITTLRARDERRVVEERLRLFSAAVEQSTEGVAVLDLEGIVLFANHAFASMHGFTADELVGKHASVFHTPDQMPALEAANRYLLEHGRFSGEIEHARRDGGSFAGEMHNVVLKDPSGAPVGMVWTLRDVTDRKRMEEELRKAEKLESLGLLAGGIAHDFNNLLTAILGNINLARHYGGDGDRAGQRLVEAEKAAARAQDLTQQLLAFSRGGMPVKEALSLGQLVEDTVGFALRGSSVRCAFDAADDLWTVEADPGQISRVVGNLVINASQAMPRGGDLRVECVNHVVGEQDPLPLPAGRYARISIVDQGSGIPREHLPRVFDPYFTTKQEGSGLGLASAYSIVKRHDGLITVESELGVGTRFDVYLPASERTRSQSPRAQSVRDIPRARVLVMDDEEMVRDVVGEMLRSFGCEAEFATEGGEAIEKYRRARESGRPFDIVMMDLTVPGGMGGKDAIQELRRYDPGVKAIVASGYSHDPIVADHARYGFRGAVGKPYTRDDLRVVLHAVLSGVGAEAESAGGPAGA